MAQTMQAHRCSMCDASSSIGKSLGCCDAARSIEPGRVGQHDRSMEGRSGQRAEPVEAPKSSEPGSWGSLEAPKSIEVGRSGSVQAAKIARVCARGAPRSVRGCAEATKIDAKSWRGATNATVRTHGSFANHRWGASSTKRAAFRRCRYACEPSEVPRLPAKTKVWHIVLHVELVARPALEKRPKSIAKSIQSRSKWVIRGTSRRPSRSKLVVRVSRSAQVDRSGSIGLGRGGQGRSWPARTGARQRSWVRLVGQFHYRYIYIYTNTP